MAMYSILLWISSLMSCLQGFSSSRHSTSLWLVLLASTLNGLPNTHASQRSFSRKTQIIKIVHLCFLLLSSFAVSSEKLIPSEVPYLCHLRGSHLYRKLVLYGPMGLPHICVTLSQSFDCFRFCYLDWYLIRPWTWVCWGKWKVSGPLEGPIPARVASLTETG